MIGKKRMKRMITVLISVCLLVGISVGARANQQTEKDQPKENTSIIVPSVDDIRMNGYPVNEMGQTYGPDVKENTGTKSVPDLILVCNEFGVEGYIRETDIDAGARTLEEAKNRKEREYSVNMYLEDGCTVIGTFTIGR